jgi:hypothetical protein
MDSLKIDIYNKLNRIKPSNKSLKYPFDFWTPEKIKITQREIQLKFKNVPDKGKVKGGSSSKVLIFT